MNESTDKEAPAKPSRAAETGEFDRFPRMVFRAGHTVRVWDRHDVDTLIVNSQAALDDALEHGWFLDPADTETTITEPFAAGQRRRGRPPKGTTMGKGKDAGELEPPETNPDNIAYDPYKDPGNPRPGEPDNAPFRNTPYDNPQSGDLPDPPTSPAEIPVQTPIPPEDQKPPGDNGDGLDKPPPGTDPPLGGEGTVAKARPENDLPDNDKGLPGKPGAILGGAGPLESKQGAKGGAKDESESLRNKGAPPGSHKAR